MHLRLCRWTARILDTKIQYARYNIVLYPFDHTNVQILYDRTNLAEGVTISSSSPNIEPDNPGASSYNDGCPGKDPVLTHAFQVSDQTRIEEMCQSTFYARRKNIGIVHTVVDLHPGIYMAVSE